jgi:hypothetical protein
VRGLGHHGVRLVPGALVDDRGVLARIGDASVHRLAAVHPVGQHLVDGPLRPRPAAARAIGAHTSLRHLARGIQLPGDGERRAGLGEAVEDPAHHRRLALDHDQPAVADLIAERRPAAHPKSSLT